MMKNKVGVYISDALNLTDAEKGAQVKECKKYSVLYGDTEHTLLKSLDEAVAYIQSDDYLHIQIVATNMKSFHHTSEWKTLKNAFVNDKQRFTESFIRLTRNTI